MHKFKEKPDTTVFTTRFVIKEGELIQYIYHHESDGTWEFISQTKANKDKDYMVVALEEIVQHDTTVLLAADLPLGKIASRKAKNDPWEIHDI